MSSPYHSTPGEPYGGDPEYRDGLPVDGPVEPIEHDGAGVEGAHGALTDPPLAFLVPRVGCDGVHHDAGVRHVHRDVASEDLQRLIWKSRCLPETVGEAGVDRGYRPLTRRPE